MKETEKVVPPVFVRRKDERKVFGISTSSIDLLIKAGKWPVRRRIGTAVVGTLYEEGRVALEALAKENDG